MKLWAEIFAAPQRLFISQAAYHDFLPESLEIMETPANPIGRTISWTIMIAATAALIWAFVGRVDVVVTARGQVVPSSGTKIIQAPETAQIAKIHVANGDMVSMGQILVSLDPTDAGADTTRLRADMEETELSIDRLKNTLAFPENAQAALGAFLKGKDPLSPSVARHISQLQSAIAEQTSKVSAMQAELESRVAETRAASAELDRLNSVLPLIQQNVETRRSLVDRGILAKLPQLDMERQLIDAQKAISVQTNKLAESQAHIVRLERLISSSRAEFSRGLSSQILEQEQRRAALSQEIVKAEHRFSRLNLRAPASGFVQQLAVNAERDLVTTGQNLMVIVPENDKIEIEARIENQNVGRVQVGQAVAVKVDAFDFTKYGLAEGRVKLISRDSIAPQEAQPKSPAAAQQAEPVFLARIELQSPFVSREGQVPRPLSIGMGVTTEIKSDRRRVIDYLLSPVIEHIDESFREP